MQGAKESHPNEFIGLLSGIVDGEFTKAEELYLAPLAEVDDESASYNPYHLPAGLRLVGSFHSHPAGSARPSQADVQMFSHSGRTHLIAAYPYRTEDVRAYDNKGKKIEFEVV